MSWLDCPGWYSILRHSPFFYFIVVIPSFIVTFGRRVEKLLSVFFSGGNHKFRSMEKKIYEKSVEPPNGQQKSRATMTTIWHFVVFNLTRKIIVHSTHLYAKAKKNCGKKWRWQQVEHSVRTLAITCTRSTYNKLRDVVATCTQHIECENSEATLNATFNPCWRFFYLSFFPFFSPFSSSTMCLRTM